MAAEELRCRLLEQALLEHRVAPLVDAPAERLARRAQEEAAHVERVAQRVEAVRIGRRPEVRRRALGLPRDHDGTLQSVPVVAAQLLGARRIELLELREPARPVVGRLERRQQLAHLLIERRIRLGRLWAAACEPAHVHGRATDEDGQTAAREHLLDGVERILVERTGRVLLVRLPQVQKLVGHPRTLLGRWLRRQSASHGTPGQSRPR